MNYYSLEFTKCIIFVIFKYITKVMYLQKLKQTIIWDTHTLT
jgi:hypothetical protein